MDQLTNLYNNEEKYFLKRINNDLEIQHTLNKNHYSIISLPIPAPPP